MEFLDYITQGNTNPPAGSINFDSSDHIRFQNGQNVTGHNYGCNRRVLIEKNIGGGEGYTVTMYNLDGMHPIWKDNIQMAPKQMKIVNVEGNIVELRGFGFDKNALVMGVPLQAASFSNYGILLMIEEGEISRAQLNMYDRNVSIVYFK